MAQRHSPPSTEQHPENLPHIGFDLFPPTAAAPAARPGPAAPTSPPALPPGHRKPSVLPYDPAADRYDPSLSYWNRNSHWLRPLIFFVLGWVIFDIKFFVLGGVPALVAGQIAMAFFLLYRALIALVVCFIGMKIIGDDIGSFPDFLFQVLSAVTFAGSIVFVAPVLGPWLIDPLILWVLFCWFFEVSPASGFLFSLATCAFTWLGLLFLFMSLLSRLTGS